MHGSSLAVLANISIHFKQGHSLIYISVVNNITTVTSIQQAIGSVKLDREQ